MSLPRPLGVDPADGVEIVANNGKYGPYVQKGKDFRTIGSEEQLLTISLDQALEILAQPKSFRRGGGRAPSRRCASSATTRSREKPVVAKDGRFGVYVTDGETNASLTKGDRLEAMNDERAYELLAVRREQIIEKGGAPGKKAAARKASAAKKAAPKKAAAKKATAKKTAAKKVARKAS